MRKTLLVLFLLTHLGPSYLSYADKISQKADTDDFKATDIVTRPVEIILAPVVGMAELLPTTDGAVEATENDFLESVITPSGFKDLSINYPGNVTVISERDIDRSNAKYVYELLRKEPGIYVSDYTHAGKTVTVDMRGFGDTATRNVLVMVDGRRLNEIDISGTDWSQIPLENVERIEILRGAGSVMYGDNASAGVINILTKRGNSGHRLKLGGDFGSYRYRNYFTSIRGSEEFASYNLFAKYKKTDGYRLNGDYDGYDIFGAMTIFPEEHLEMDLSGGYHKDWYGLPSGLQRTEIDQIGARGSTTPNDRCKTETTFLKISPGIRFCEGSMDHSLGLDVWGKKKRTNMINWDDASGWIPWYPSWDTSQIDSISGSVKYTNRYLWDENANNLVLGVDMFSSKNRLLTVTPQWGTYNQLKISKSTLGIYVNDKIDLFGKFIANGGFRQEWAVYGFDQNRGAGSVTEAGLMETKSPRVEAFDAGVEYKYLENGGIYGRFSRSYRLPATDEFYSRWTGLNSGLKHQKADTWEVGLKDRNWKYFQPAVNFFLMKTDDEIFYDPTFGPFGDNRNYDGIKRFGIETGVKSDVLDWFGLYFNYTYLDANFDEGIFNDKKVPMVPDHKIAWGVNIVPENFIEINFTSEYISEQYTINDQENRMPKLKSYLVCGGKITFKYKGIKAYFGVNNIFNTTYSEIAVSNVAGTITDFHPAPERNYSFGVSAEF